MINPGIISNGLAYALCESQPITGKGIVKHKNKAREDPLHGLPHPT
jgi:hypothetical protein